MLDYRDKSPTLHTGAVSAIAVQPGVDCVLSAGEDGYIRQVQITQAGTVNAARWGDIADCVALYDIKVGINI